MGEPKPLQPAELEKLVDALLKQLAEHETMSFRQIDKEKAKRISGVVLTDNNISDSDWEVAWDRLGERAEVNCVRGNRKSAVYEYLPSMVALGELQVREELNTGETSKLAKALKETVAEAAKDGQVLNICEGRKVAMLRAKIRISLSSRLWGPIMRSAGSGENAITSPDKDHLVLKQGQVKQSVVKTEPVTPPVTPVAENKHPAAVYKEETAEIEAIAIKGLKITAFTVVTVEMPDGPVQIKAPSGKMVEVTTTGPNGEEFKFTAHQITVEVKEIKTKST